MNDEELIERRACPECGRMRAETNAMAAHCRAIEVALGVGCVEEAVEKFQQLRGENKTLRETPVGVALTSYRRMAYERMELAQTCERLRTAIEETLSENGHLADGDVCTLIKLKRAVIPHNTPVP